MGGPGAEQTRSLLDLCARQGLWLTSKRQSMICLLDQLDAPFDAAEALALFGTKGLRVSRASVYNLLRDLKAAGVLHLVGSRGHRDCYRKANEAPAAGLLNVASLAWTPLDDPTLMTLASAAAEEMGFRLAGRIVIEVIPIDDRRTKRLR